jgi:acetolactate synthase-1/2/3 large subunit
MTTGADIIADVIVARGLKRCFIYPGGTIAPLIDALDKREVSLMVGRSEQGSAYAALAVARLTGEPQVCLCTSGPGVTNMVTVVADAYYDSTPLVVVCGQISTNDLQRGDLLGAGLLRQRGFQEVPTLAIMYEISKDVLRPFLGDDLNKLMYGAFWIAMRDRPGPVVIDLPMDIQKAVVVE